MPSITLASFLLPRVIRLTAANVDRAMREDYVRTARAAGFSPTAILWRHVLPNAVLGTIALVGVQFGFLLSGFPRVLDLFSGWAPQALVDGIASESFLTHFASLSKGVIDLRDIVYLGLTIGAFLYANTIVLQWKQAD